MTDAEILKIVILNLPNFVFAAVCVVILHKQNTRMMEMIERKCFENCEQPPKKED